MVGMRTQARYTLVKKNNGKEKGPKRLSLVGGQKGNLNFSINKDYKYPDGKKGEVVALQKKSKKKKKKKKKKKREKKKKKKKKKKTKKKKKKKKKKKEKKKKKKNKKKNKKKPNEIEKGHGVYLSQSTTAKNKNICG